MMKANRHHRPRLVNRGDLTNLILSSRNESVFSGIDEIQVQRAMHAEKAQKIKERTNLAESVDFAGTVHFGSPFMRISGNQRYSSTLHVDGNAQIVKATTKNHSPAS